MGFLKDLGGPIGGAIGFAVGGPAGAAIGASIGGGISSASAAKKASKAVVKATEAGIAEQRAAREAFDVKTQPFVDIGLEGGKQLQNFLADPSQELTGANQRLQDFISDPSQQLAEINPVVDFFRQQGFEQVQESAAAMGRLGAGGTLKDLTRFDANLTSTIVPQLQAQRFDELTSNVQTQNQLQNDRFNKLFNVTGLGANTAVGQGTTGLQTASNVSNLLGSRGVAQAQGIAGRNQAILGGVENVSSAIGAFPDLFSSTPPPPSAPQASPTEISNALTGVF